MELFIFSLYAILTAYVFSYSLAQLGLLINYLGSKSRSVQTPHSIVDIFPMVTIQLPIYNERYVVERLIDAIAKFDYPKECMEIQILDDSSDETSEIIAQKIRQIQGINNQHLRRKNRQGFKAGALAAGLKNCKGEFIAIFDADFIPPKDFLQKTIPYFQAANVGVVQTRWQHINEDYSLLTKLQAFGLDAHFTIEQGGRNAHKHFINFNGTAGIWRKKAILDAGGWEADTLTEDLDLSYRAQMKSWEFVYLEQVACPAELPVTMNAIKSQQYRWAKGAAECAVKNLYNFLITKDLKLSTKFHGFYHLMNSAVFVVIFLLSILSLFLVFFTAESMILTLIFRFTAFFQLSWPILGYFYWISFRKTELGFFTFFKRFIGFLSLMMGLSFHNSIAVVEGWLGKQTPFVRTPKFNVKKQSDVSWQRNAYLSKSINKSTWIELLLMLCFVVVLFIELKSGNFGFVPFHLMLIFGYGTILFYTFKQAK